jgi:hypothetical protein
MGALQLGFHLSLEDIRAEEFYMMRVMAKVMSQSEVRNQRAVAQSLPGYGIGLA